jgi:hypothetical protein
MIRALFLFAAAWPAVAAGPPLALNPRNPHYFIFRGKPAVLITSGEHYGAVLNLDFDYRRYLRTLAADRLNLTRTFVGNYREAPGMFKISENTLAPAPTRFIAPWPQSEGKFDLTRWNDEFFARLRDFVGEASRRSVVVEVTLFCPFYEEGMWDISPMNAKNNVNGIGNVKRTEALTLKDERLLKVQDALVRKIVTELRDFDNVYYEICNEPYFGGVTLEWQHHIARTISEAESSFPNRHLISQNIANGSKKIEAPDPLVSIFNFHYARPPEAVTQNYSLNKPVGCNETGFDGNADTTYRIQGWDFLMAGGALYNNLDYSFTTSHPDGTFAVPATNPGGGSPAFRKQMGILHRFFDDMDFLSMAPAAVDQPQDASARLLAEPGRTYAIYLHRGRVVKDQKPQYQVDSARKSSQLNLELPSGGYRSEWTDTRTGKARGRERFRHAGGRRTFQSPSYEEDIVLRVRSE